MLYTTFKLAREAGACRESYQKFARHVGGVKKYGENTPIPLSKAGEVLGIQDALWCLRCVVKEDSTERIIRHLVADFAEHVLPIFEKKFPGDDRPRKAIEVGRLYADGKIGDAARDAAWAAAWDAARDAAWAAARDAAWDAASAAAWDAAWAAAWAAARDAAWAAASAAARDAAWAAAWAAARDAAWAAARDAEESWQLSKLEEVK